MEKSDIKALTFDLFGTILDLGGSLTPYIAEFLDAKGAEVSPDRFWDQWRGAAANRTVSGHACDAGA